jgi:hypothetical protein
MVLRAKHWRTNDLRRKKLTTEVCPFERTEDGTLEMIGTVATRVERVEQLLSLMREAGLSTLLALDRELHLLFSFH